MPASRSAASVAAATAAAGKPRKVRRPAKAATPGQAGMTDDERIDALLQQIRTRGQALTTRIDALLQRLG